MLTHFPVIATVCVTLALTVSSWTSYTLLYYPVCNVVLPSMQCLQPSFHSFPSVLISVTECFPLFSSWSDCVGWSVHFHAHMLMKCLMSRSNISQGHSSYFMCIGTVGSIMIWRFYGFYGVCKLLKILTVSLLVLQYSFLFEINTRTACCFGLLLLLFFVVFHMIKLQKKKKYCL